VKAYLSTLLNPAELFRHDTDTVQVAPGDFLFREGDQRDKMYVLLEGEMEVRLDDYVPETAGPGEQAALIQKVSVQLERSKAAPQTVLKAARLRVGPALTDQRPIER